MAGLSLHEGLTTTRTVRKRLDLERPVPREVVERCLRTAFQAPNGSNGQLWAWVLVDDPELRAGMAKIYAGGMDEYVARPDYTQTGLFPVAYTIGTTFKPADRSASESLVHWNRFGA